MTRHQDPSGFQPNDKVRIRSGEHAGARGVVRSEANGLVEIILSTGEIMQLRLDEITNYSLAARRAWQVMPKQAGRPKSHTPARKKMVSVRVDQDLWKRLAEAVECGLISSREEAVNVWLRERLDEIMG